MNALGRQVRREFERGEAVCGKVLTLLRAVSHRGRFRIVCLLARGEFSVTEIVEIVDAGGLPNVSQHLQLLALAGLVAKRRQRQQVLYRLADARGGRLVAFLRAEYLQPGPARPRRSRVPAGPAAASASDRRHDGAGPTPHSTH